MPKLGVHTSRVFTMNGFIVCVCGIGRVTEKYQRLTLILLVANLANTK